MPVNAGKCHFWEYCPCRYLPVNTGDKYRCKGKRSELGGLSYILIDLNLPFTS